MRSSELATDSPTWRDTARRPGRPEQAYHAFVAGHLAFEVEPPIEPPRGWMPTGNEVSRKLRQQCQIVAPFDVRPFVHDDAIEIRGVE